MRATWTPEEWSAQPGRERDGEPVGAQTIPAEGFAVHRTVDTGSWLGQAFQGRGLGKEMRYAVLAFAFDGLDARVAESEAFLDNAASNACPARSATSERLRRLAPRASRARPRFRMTVEDWGARPRPPVEIEGLDACRELFGLTA